MCEAHVAREIANQSFDDITSSASPPLLARHLMRAADLSQDGEVSENEIATMLGQSSSLAHRRFADFAVAGRPSRFKAYDVDKGVHIW